MTDNASPRDMPDLNKEFERKDTTICVLVPAEAWASSAVYVEALKKAAPPKQKDSS